MGNSAVDNYLSVTRKVAAEAVSKREALLSGVRKLASAKSDYNNPKNEAARRAEKRGANPKGPAKQLNKRDQAAADLPDVSQTQNMAPVSTIQNKIKTPKLPNKGRLAAIAALAAGTGLFGRDQLAKLTEANNLVAENVPALPADAAAVVAPTADAAAVVPAADASDLNGRLANAGIGAAGGAATGALLNYLLNGGVATGAIGGGVAGGAAGAASPELAKLLARLG